MLNVRGATGLDLWRWRNPLPQGNRLKSVAWGNGRWVAVGNAGSIVTSTNGETWVTATNCSGGLRDVAAGPGGFVAPASSTKRLLTSPDGLAWTEVNTHHGLELEAVAFGKVQYFVVGEGGAMMTSTDGRQ